MSTETKAASTMSRTSVTLLQVTTTYTCVVGSVASPSSWSPCPTSVLNPRSRTSPKLFTYSSGAYRLSGLNPIALNPKPSEAQDMRLKCAMDFASNDSFQHACIDLGVVRLSLNYLCQQVKTTAPEPFYCYV